MKTKVCSKCKRLQPVGEFNKQEETNDGLQYWCRHCAIEYYQKYYWDNPDVPRRRSIEWAKNNPEKVKFNRGRWRKNNPDYNKRWRKDNQAYLKKYREEYKKRKEYFSKRILIIDSYN